MYNDPTNPYRDEDPACTGGISEVETDMRFGDPEDDGYWKLIGGVWRWITEPLGRTAVPTS